MGSALRWAQGRRKSYGVPVLAVIQNMNFPLGCILSGVYPFSLAPRAQSSALPVPVRFYECPQNDITHWRLPVRLCSGRPEGALWHQSAVCHLGTRRDSLVVQMIIFYFCNYIWFLENITHQLCDVSDSIT